MKNAILSLLAALMCGGVLAAEIQAWPIRDRFLVSSLDGEWDFTLARNEPTNEVNTVVKETGKIMVPGCWEAQGFKKRQYGKEMEDLTGTYRRTFGYDSRWDGKRVVLRFDGVLFGFAVRVNGVDVGGMSEGGSAYNMYQFDITDALKKDGANELEVAVRTRSRGWLFDTIDDWCFAGIFRSVEIFAVPQTYIKDIVFRTDEIDLAAKNAKSAKVSVAVETAGEDDATVQVSLIDIAGRHVFDAQGKGGEFKGVVKNPDLWTAETPNLYTLTVQLVDASGKVTERAVQKVGIRTVSADDKHIYVNGQSITMRGVCWNEVDGALGRSITPELRREEMLKMKVANINYIRTAHYPFGIDFYELADELGFYVVDEVPLARRGEDLLKDDKELAECLARTERTVRRDRNHPSVIIWTVGNENVVTANALASMRRVKELDPTRLTGFPQTPGPFSKWISSRDNDCADVVMGHYFREDRMKIADKATKPFLQTEFAHSCAGGFSDFEYAWQRVRDTEHYAGGSIWLWRDQAVLAPDGGVTDAIVKQRPLAPGVTKLADGYYLDTFGEYGTDGICYADGTPKEAYWLVRRVYSPVQVELKDGAFVVENCHDFISLRGWSLEVNGERIPLSAAPHATETVPEPEGYATVRVIDPTGRAIMETAFGKTPILGVSIKRAGSAFYHPTNFLLRVGRKKSMLVDFANAKKRNVWTAPHILTPEVLNEREEDGTKVYTLRWRRGNKPDAKQYFDGEVRVAGTKVSYTLTPSPDCKGSIVECGLAFDCGAEATRFDWIGEGPFTGVPGKSKMNAPGAWSLHKDDLYFDGNRRNVSFAQVGGIAIRGDNLDVGIENANGRVILSQNAFVDNYGNKFVLFGKPRDWSQFTLSGTFDIGKADAQERVPPVAPFRPLAETYGW